MPVEVAAAASDMGRHQVALRVIGIGGIEFVHRPGAGLGSACGDESLRGPDKGGFDARRHSPFAGGAVGFGTHLLLFQWSMLRSLDVLYPARALCVCVEWSIRKRFKRIRFKRSAEQVDSIHGSTGSLRTESTTYRSS